MPYRVSEPPKSVKVYSPSVIAGTGTLDGPYTVWGKLDGPYINGSVDDIVKLAELGVHLFRLESNPVTIDINLIIEWFCGSW